MTNLNGQPTSSKIALVKYWQRLPIIIRAIVSGVFVSTVGGVIAATLIFALIPMPWSLAIMAAMLWIYWKFFSGSWWPQSTAEIRREYFRNTKLSKNVWKWGLVNAALMVFVFQSLRVVTFRVIEFPADKFTLGIDISSYPNWQAWLLLIMVAVLAGITEDVGFRGYMQVPLEKRYGPVAGIAIVSVIFVLIHFSPNAAIIDYFQIFIGGVMLGIIAHITDSLLIPIIAHTVSDIISAFYWRSGVAGVFEYRPIVETGVDVHFIVWVLIFIVSVILFIGAAKKTLVARRKG